MAVSFLLLALIAGCRNDSSTTDSGDSNSASAIPSEVAGNWKRPSTTGYAGGEACRECHAEIVDSFQRHPMARSIQNVSDLPGASEAAVEINGGVWRYKVELSPSKHLIHREIMDGRDGDPIYEQSVRMDYLVGSGRRAIAYLHREGDLLFQSPLNWYTSSSTWGLSPGYVPDDPRRFRRRVTDDCIACHAGRMVLPADEAPHRYPDPVFHQMGISCENCHGPSADHVAFHRSESVAPGVKSDPILQLGELSPDKRGSLCYQCHLQATARVLRPGRSDLDFRPGMNLEDIWTVIDATQEGDKGRAVQHVQQMRESMCYQRSDGALSCLSCHDPHSIPDAASRIPFFRTRCLSCHTEDVCHAPMSDRRKHKDSCIACHMPSGLSSNISHVSQTDHRILRRPDDEENAPATNNNTQWKFEFFDDADTRLPEWEANRALALAISTLTDREGLPTSRQIPSLLRKSLRIAPEDYHGLTLMGTFLREQQDFTKAIDYFQKAAENPRAEESSLGNLLTLYYLKSDWTQALAASSRLLELDPRNARYHSLRADVLKNTGEIQDAIQSAQRALQLDPTLLPVRIWLVDTLRETRSPELAAEETILQQYQAVINQK